MSTDKFSNTPTADIIDEVGNLSAAIKEMQVREKELKDELTKRLEEKVEVHGSRFAASKTTVHSDRIDTKKVEGALGGKDAMKLAGFYNSTASTRINLKVLAVWEAA